MLSWEKGGQRHKTRGTWTSSRKGVVVVIVVNCSPHDGCSIKHICTHKVKPSTFRNASMFVPVLE